MKKILSKSFWIKFLLMDFIFFTVFYLTFIYTFPLEKIIEHNKSKITKALGKDFTYKSISLSPTLNLNVENLKLKNNKLSKKELNSIIEKLKEFRVARKEGKDINQNELNKFAKNLNMDSEDLSILVSSTESFSTELNKGLLIKEINIDPKVFKIISSKKAALDFDATLMGGEINGTYFVKTTESKKKSKKKSKIRPKEVDYINLNLTSINLTKISNYLALKLPVHGKLSGNIEAELKPSGNKKDISSLKTDLVLDKAVVGPGKVKAMGSYATMDAISLGSGIKLKGKTDKRRKFEFDPININSPDLEASLKGSITMIRNKTLNLKTKFKLTESFLTKNKKFKTIIGTISKFKRRDKFYGMKILGTAKSPRVIKYTN